MNALSRLVTRELAARQDPTSGEILLLVGAEQYAEAVASGRLARAAGVIRITLVDPPECPPDRPAPPRRQAHTPREEALS